MLRLFKQIWRSIREFLRQLFGFATTQTAQRSRRGEVVEATSSLTDTDYEFLFSQLLEGVAHGWHEGRILKFFEQLEERGKQQQWVEWLERFGAKAQASSAPNLQLAARMIRLGELAQSFPAIKHIGETSYAIGRQLYNREAKSAVWEYEGPDVGEIALPTLDEEMEAQPPSPAAETETFTLEELLARLSQDQGLAEQIAQQLGISSLEPAVLIEALMEEFQITGSPPEEQPRAKTVEDWFNQGLQEANSGDLEGAIASWEKALDLDPDLIQAWHNHGSALGNLGRLEEAIASFDHALALNAGDAQAWNSKGNALYNLQQWENAIACWDKALALEPSYYQAWYNRGNALENIGRTSEARQSYSKALEIEPEFELAQAKLDDLLNNN